MVSLRAQPPVGTGLVRRLGTDARPERYTSLPLENGASSYGEFLASTNMGARAITYSNIDHTSLEGDQTKLCLVRVWQPV